MTSKCGKNIRDTLPYFFCSYQILTSSVIYYWTDARHQGIYFLNIKGLNTFYLHKFKQIDIGLFSRPFADTPQPFYGYCEVKPFT